MARRHYKQQTTEADVVGQILKTLWDLFMLPFKGSGGKKIKPQTAATISQYWTGVDSLLAAPETQPMAVTEADKLLDAALQALNLPGHTMADRLRAVESRLGKDLANEVWRAHKLRNQIAHEVGMRLAPGQAQIAVNSFAKALNVLGVPV